MVGYGDGENEVVCGGGWGGIVVGGEACVAVFGSVRG